MNLFIQYKKPKKATIQSFQRAAFGCLSMTACLAGVDSVEATLADLHGGKVTQISGLSGGEAVYNGLVFLDVPESLNYLKSVAEALTNYGYDWRQATGDETDALFKAAGYGSLMSGVLSDGVESFDTGDQLRGMYGMGSNEYNDALSLMNYLGYTAINYVRWFTDPDADGDFTTTRDEVVMSRSPKTNQVYLTFSNAAGTEPGSSFSTGWLLVADPAVVPVPEPASTFSSLALVTAALLNRRQRRKAQ